MVALSASGGLLGMGVAYGDLGGAFTLIAIGVTWLGLVEAWLGFGSAQPTGLHSAIVTGA